MSIAISDSNLFIRNYKDYVNETNIRDELNVIEDIKNINEITFLQDEKKSVILHLANLELINKLSFSESINYSNKIFNLKIPDDLNDLFSLFDENLDLKFGILIDTFLVLSSSKDQLKKILTSFDNKRTLINDLYYQKNRENSLNKLSFLWLANTKRIKEDEIFKNSLNKKLETKLYPFISFEGIVDKKLSLLNFYISKLKQENYQEVFIMN